jgi:hypothetical protein
VPHPLDQGRDRLRSLVGSTDPAGPRLPLVHSTDVFAIGNILEDGGKIMPQSCPVFEPERLTYLFYGRAAYRPNLAEEPTNLDHFLPVCLIFKISASIVIKRIFPFDSGAFSRDFYKAYLHKNMRLGDFLLEADEETPGRVVRRFFTDNTNYIVGQKAVSKAIDPGQFEAKSYEMLIGSQGANSLDSRGGGVEIQTDQPIDLLKDIEAVILPSSQARSEIGKRLADSGIDVIPYRLLGRLRPNEFTGEIYDKCVDYLCRKNLVDADRL